MDEMILELHNELISKEQEINRLKDIIREVREYIKKNYPVCAGSELLEILDKVEDK